MPEFVTSIPNYEKLLIRELAKKYLEYAYLPVMRKREELWTAHNDLKDTRPLIVMELDTFKEDFLPHTSCQTALGREIENFFQYWILNHELINDDKIIPLAFPIDWDIDFIEFGIPKKIKYAMDESGRSLAYKTEHPIIDLERDMEKLSTSIFKVDRKATEKRKSMIEEIIGDIIPIEIQNRSLYWHAMPTLKVIELMGMEAFFIAMYDSPEALLQLMDFVTKDILCFIHWLEKEGLLTPNNGNTYIGSGSYGFTDSLPLQNGNKTSHLEAGNLWGNINSQESIGISPEMYHDFIFPSYKTLAEEFGLVYYGCCEPVDPIWDDSISLLPNLRKVSVSPWADETIMGEKLRGSDIIYSRKPSPNFIGVGSFDEIAFREHISHTIQTAAGCSLEIIFRDIYSLNGDINKPGRAVRIVKELISS